MDLGRVAWDGRHSAKGNSGEELQCDTWEVNASRRWPRPALSGGRRYTGGQRKQEGRQEVEEGWIYLQIQKILGTLL